MWLVGAHWELRRTHLRNWNSEKTRVVGRQSVRRRERKMRPISWQDWKSVNSLLGKLEILTHLKVLSRVHEKISMENTCRHTVLRTRLDRAKGGRKVSTLWVFQVRELACWYGRWEETVLFFVSSGSTRDWIQGLLVSYISSLIQCWFNLCVEGALISNVGIKDTAVYSCSLYSSRWKTLNRNYCHTP